MENVFDKLVFWDVPLIFVVVVIRTKSDMSFIQRADKCDSYNRVMFCRLQEHANPGYFSLKTVLKNG